MSNVTDRAYTVGKQPCQNFKPRLVVTAHASWDNVHECYRCKEGTVSFCENCCKDHHKDGYENCKEAA